MRPCASWPRAPCCTSPRRRAWTCPRTSSRPPCATNSNASVLSTSTRWAQGVSRSATAFRHDKLNDRGERRQRRCLPGRRATHRERHRARVRPPGAARQSEPRVCGPARARGADLAQPPEGPRHPPGGGARCPSHTLVRFLERYLQPAAEPNEEALDEVCALGRCRGWPVPRGLAGMARCSSRCGPCAPRSCRSSTARPARLRRPRDRGAPRQGRHPRSRRARHRRQR